MNPSDLPLVAWLSRASPGDPVFDALMIIGPVLLVVVAILSRTTVTTTMVGFYIASFFVFTIYNGIGR